MSRRDSAKRRARPRIVPVRKLVIFGVGLIGGSFALALKQKRAVGRVVGVGRSRANLLTARRLGIIDEIGKDAASAVTDADLVLVAVPLAQTGAVLSHIAPHLDPRAIVTDAGSTKHEVIAWARRHLGSAFPRFVPAHPIAGTEKSGAAAAHAKLFENHQLIITPQPETDAAAVKRVAALWRLVGMRVAMFDAAEHDRIYAAISHLPHVISYALVNYIAERPDGKKLFRHTGGGFRDASRLGGSSPEMWRDICCANRDALLQALDGYLAELEVLRGMIEGGDGDALLERFAHSRAARAKWLPAI
jgi:prephenate dehydrogenase